MKTLHNNLKVLIVLFTVIFGINNLFAQGTWETYTTVNTGSDSLIGSRVWTIFTDSDNNTWFGTSAGISEYDGNDWISFTVFDGLTFPSVHVICEDNQGIFWFGTSFGISKFDGSDFINYTSFNSGLNSDLIRDMIQDNENYMWFVMKVYPGGEGGGISKFDGDDVWESYTEENSDLPDNNVKTVIQENNETFWFGTDDGITNFDGINWTTYTTNDGLVNDTVNDIIQDALNNLWIGTNNGVSKYDGTNWTTYTTGDGLADNQVNAIMEDNQGNIWFATGNGVSKFDGATWITYTHPDGLAYDLVYDLTQDENGNIWFATRLGASKFDGSTWIEYSTHDGGLADNRAWAIVQDDSGNMWFSGRDGVSSFDGMNWTNYSDYDGLGELYNKDMIKDSQGNIWFSGSSGTGAVTPGVVTKYDGLDFTIYELDGSFAECIYEDSQGNIWFGSSQGDGVIMFDGTDWTIYNDELLTDGICVSIAEDEGGNMYFAKNYDGVVTFDGTNWTEFDLPETADISEIFKDSQGYLWFASSGLIYKYDGADFLTFTVDDGLIDDVFQDIDEDSQGYLWFVAGHAVNKFDGSTWTTYTSEGLIQSYGVYSVAADINDDIWIGTNWGGVSKFHLEEVTLNITFQADMTDLFEEGFDPDIHGIELRGEFNGWTAGEILQPDPINDSLYFITREITGFVGDTVEWKFKAYPDNYFVNNGWEIYPGGGGEYGNRQLALPWIDSTLIPVLPDILFANNTFTVNSTDDTDDIFPGNGICDDGTGNCTLRAAIQEANACNGIDTIAFDIPGSAPHTFQPSVPLPALGESVIIDGTTEPDFTGTPVIEIDGSLITDFEPGIQILAGNCVVKGLVINRFIDYGINIMVNGNNVIEGNFLGTDISGTIALGNGNGGIGLGSSNNIVGGTEPGSGNLISGNVYVGISISGTQSNGNNVFGNFIGTNITGLDIIPNGTDGINIAQGASNNIIGGTETGAGNVISGNDRYGITVGNLGTDGNKIQGNYIGTDLTGSAEMGNVREGVCIWGDASDNLIGGDEEGAGNIIAFNIGAGILISNTDGTIQNHISQNSIFSNVETGIDLSLETVSPYRDGITPNDPGDADSGPNNLQNFPEIATIVIDGAGDLWIDYFVDSDPTNSTYPISVQFFKADDEGEGQTYFGSDTFLEADFTAGNKSVNLGNAEELEISNGDVIVATATDDNGNTSEFSSTLVIVGIAETGSYSKENLLLHNYPNPFNSSTIIEFTLCRSDFVNLTIYNAFGESIKTLVNKSLNPGKHKVDFQADNLPDGVYFYNLQLESGSTKTGKMTLMQ